MTAAMKPFLQKLAGGHALTRPEAEEAFGIIMSGDATASQIGAFLMALRLRGETVQEIAGAVSTMRGKMLKVEAPDGAIDIVGTGGDPYGAVLNISSVASIVAAAAGVPVVKHGNRGASSASGASDVLSALGLNLDITPDRVAEVLAETGITFAFAALFHPGFRHAGPTRKELGISTLFNILGPLCNPARPNASAVGVASLERVPLVVGVFQTRGATALVYRGDDGIDKLTTTGHSHIWEVSRGFVTEHDLDPADLGIPRADIQSLLGADAAHNASVARAVLAGEPGPVRDIVLLNAAGGLAAYELSREPELLQEPILERLATQLERAASVIDSGAASAKLDEWVAATNR